MTTLCKTKQALSIVLYFLILNLEIYCQSTPKIFFKNYLYLQVNVCLECISTSLRTLKRSFIRCSAQATITHLKKFVAKKVLNGMEKYREVSIILFLSSY